MRNTRLAVALLFAIASLSLQAQVRRGAAEPLFVTQAASPAARQPVARFADESDRAAFRDWFVVLADAQFYRPTPDVTDCAALVRHAFREAVRSHSEEWLRQAALPLPRVYPDVRSRPTGSALGLPLFRIAAQPAPRYAEFADARTLIAHNAHLVSRETSSARPGDLLYFVQPTQQAPHHVMVFLGRSIFEPEGDDWIVYHTGPSVSASSARGEGSSSPDGTDAGLPRRSTAEAGEVRKVRLRDLVRHPSPRWRPLVSNPQFVGVFRWDVL